MIKKSLRVTTILICENAFFSEDKKLNIIGIFDKIFSPTFPSMHPLLALAAMFEGQPNKSYTVTIETFTPDGRPLLPTNTSTFQVSTAGKANLIIKASGVQFLSEGEYTFRILEGKHLLGEARLEAIGVKGNNLQGKLPN